MLVGVSDLLLVMRLQVRHSCKLLWLVSLAAGGQQDLEIVKDYCSLNSEVAAPTPVGLPHCKEPM